ncbi:MAG: 2OG-Fe(II) oxygenase [Pseudohaliea sp.]
MRTTAGKANVRNRVLFQSRCLSIYLVHYAEGHRVMPHVDMVAEGRLYKLNCVLVKPRRGGEFSCERSIFDLLGRLVLFRPDRYQHEVTRIEDGSRWLLSVALNRP